MNILACKPFHDGTVVSVTDGRLDFSIENEKDSHPRMSPLGADVVLRTGEYLAGLPDVFALGGWRGCGGGYFGLAEGAAQRRQIFGRPVDCFTSSHERSHILGAYGMSPFEQGRPCYALTWEGTIGRFYEIDRDLRITGFPTTLSYPGYRYIYLYHLASKEKGRHGSMAGKLMALAGWRNPHPENDADTLLRDRLLTPDIPESVERIETFFPKKQHLTGYSWIDGGLASPQFRSFARRFSDALFEIFHRFARRHLTGRLPLLISGGCALNCEWNNRWRDCGLFPEVFIPPCPNDSGSAIGTAIDAQFHYTGKAKLAWTVYAGEAFHHDCDLPDTWKAGPLDPAEIARSLQRGEIVAWVQGRCEIGPRALGHRSILASPCLPEMAARLNALKEREPFRPIAPVCLADEAAGHFAGTGVSPHMLFFQHVLDPSLPAVTHDDGSARMQTIAGDQEPALHGLLKAFRALTGKPVLCNTSLNFKGCGFINRLSHLLQFAGDKGIRTLVIDDTTLVLR